LREFAGKRDARVPFEGPRFGLAKFSSDDPEREFREMREADERTRVSSRRARKKIPAIFMSIRET